jgi:hypothetical protein
LKAKEMCKTSTNEVILFGSPDNDYPTGDFVWNCIHCQSDFHGNEYEYVCYECARIEDEQNKVKVNITSYLFPLVIAAILIFCGYLFKGLS